MSLEGGPTRLGLSDQPTVAQSPTAAPTPAIELTPEALTRIAAAVAREDSIPGWVGRYRLIEVIGTGGMGEVWRAEQEQPIRRTVALKLVKPGMDTREVIARFQAERQALALLNHANVAKVLDAGATDLGRPYFVMEFVPGEPVTAFCDRNAYTIEQRLQLFSQACAAVGHAHQKGILHRDLKPGNILVTTESGNAQIKVIDFGVAKALQTPPGEETLHTVAGALVGTPEYMSPEQALSDGRDVDTRSDIYSLGVVLYELLSGALPFEPKELRGSGIVGIQRIIREVDPPRPSARLSGLTAAEGETIARQRRMQLPELTRALRRELEWIPLKAMRKESDQRYATASEFAQDIDNYLSHRPLLAGPESRRYRVRKFVRRNKVSLAVAAAFVLLLAGGTGLYVRGVRAEQRKTLAALAEAESQRVLAEHRADETNQVADFEGRMLTNINVRQMGNSLRQDMLAEAARGWRWSGLTEDELAQRTTQLEALLADANFTNPAIQSLNQNILQRALDTIDRQFANQPLVKARLLQQIANMLQNLMLPNKAMAPQTEALAIRRRELHDDHPDTLASIIAMGGLLGMKGDWKKAEPLAREALATRRRTVGGDDRISLGALRLLGEAVQRQGRLREAEQYHRESESASRRVLLEDDPDQLDAMLRLGQVLLWERKLREAEACLQETLQRTADALGENHPQTMAALTIMGTLNTLQGNLELAKEQYQRALKWYRAADGDDHRRSLFVLMQLGVVLRKQGRLGEAEGYLTSAYAGLQRVLGDDHTDTLLAEEGLAMLRQAQGNFAEAERLFADLYRRVPQLEIAPTDAARLMSGYGTCLVAMSRSRYAEAEPLLMEAYRRMKQLELDRHERMRDVLAALAEICDQTGRPDEAARWRTEFAKSEAATQPATRQSDLHQATSGAPPWGQ